MAATAFHIENNNACPAWHGGCRLNPPHLMLYNKITDETPEVVVAQRHRHADLVYISSSHDDHAVAADWIFASFAAYLFDVVDVVSLASSAELHILWTAQHG